MDHETTASTAPVKQTTVDFWRGMLWALVGTAAGAIAALLATVLHQSILLGSAILAGIWLYRDMKVKRRKGQPVASPM
jgi:hypothetical protein